MNPDQLSPHDRETLRLACDLAYATLPSPDCALDRRTYEALIAHLAALHSPPASQQEAEPWIVEARRRRASGVWTIVAPNGDYWDGDSPTACVAAATQTPEADAPPKPAGRRYVSDEESKGEYSAEVMKLTAATAPQAADAGVTDFALLNAAADATCNSGHKMVIHDADALAMMRAAIALSRTASSADGAGEKARREGDAA